jgi:virginiamycin B lyase
MITEYPIPTTSVFPQAITAGPDGALWFTESGVGGHGIGRITTDGSVTEFPIADGNQFTSIATGPDGALWFPDNQRNTIYRMTTFGTITEFLLPNPNSGPLYIARGQGQTLWFTEPGSITGFGNRLGKITTSGAITEFTIPTPASYPNRITVGPDRAIWFTESAPGNVARFGP